MFDWKKLVEYLIKKRLPGYHLAKNPPKGRKKMKVTG